MALALEPFIGSEIYKENSSSHSFNFNHTIPKNIITMLIKIIYLHLHPFEGENKTTISGY